MIDRNRSLRRPAASLYLRAALFGLLVATEATAAPRQLPSAEIHGQIVDEAGRAVSGARVQDQRSGSTVHSDGEGTFRFPAPLPRPLHLVVEVPGYAATEWLEGAEAVTPGDLPLRIVLLRDRYSLDPIAVTGSRRAVRMSDSPVRVEVVPDVVLRRFSTNNLTEALPFLNGITNQVECGVCYTNSLRINGMEGPYTAVLIDGMPILSSLASVYGLNGIHPAFIEQVEIIKGPASTLYGSEAMGGVINVITKDVRFAPRFALDLSTSSDAELNLDAGASFGRGDLSGFVGGNAAWNDRFVDRNGDAFSDFALQKRGSLFGKLDIAPGGVPRGVFTVRSVYEDRFGGVEAWTRRDRGSSALYGESILTKRFETLGSWRFSSPGWALEGSWTHHDQRSWYGANRYDAQQAIAYGTLSWNGQVSGHDLLSGLTLRHQSYDDNTPATESEERRFIPGLFLQDEMRIAGAARLLAGLRLDHHEAHGVIPSPRLALMWDAGEHTTLRINSGTGFRVVHLFTEDHAALTGSREVVIAGALRPEQSWSVSFNLNQVVEFGPNPMMIDLDLFHTRFSNRIQADYDTDPNLIVYDNLSGYALTRGVSLSVNQNVGFDRFLYSLGVTFQEVFAVEDGVREAVLFAPGFRAVAGATLNLSRIPLRLDYTGTLTGPMRLPGYQAPFERATRSPLHSVHNLLATLRVREGFEGYLQLRNLFDYAQPSPLVDPENPFGDAFDTAWVYGPIRGRSVQVGVRVTGVQ